MGVITGAIVSVWAIMKFIVSQNFRLDDNISKNLMFRIKNSHRKFEINNEFSINKKFPSIYNCFVLIDGVFIYFTRNERLLNAGWQPKEVITEVYFIRWQRKKMESILYDLSESDDRINVMALLPSGSDKLGELSTSETPEIYLDEHLYQDIEKDIQDVMKGIRPKTSLLLYGSPGAGKTRLIKYFSQKYRIPIYTVFLHPEYSNLDIMLMFSSIPKRSIILFEDFDNYFNKRECTIKNQNIKFTFDVILNVLDGVYNDYKECIFIMTCNDIEKIDDSLKRRPSRMRFVREITPPSFQKRMEILGNHNLSKMTEGMTTDQIFFAKSLMERYSNNEILRIVNNHVDSKE